MVLILVVLLSQLIIQQSSNRHGREKDYMVPADDERALYAQIIDMRIQDLQRTCIQLVCKQQNCLSSILHFFQDRRGFRYRELCHSQQRDNEGRWWEGGGGSEDSEGRVRGGGHGQVPPGGHNHGTVQTPQCSEAPWSGDGR